MATLEWVRFGVGAAFLLGGLLTFAFELLGVFRFHYVLNRMQIAATGDTLGIGFSLIGLMIMSGWNFTTLKFMLIVILLWFSSPVSSHMLARLEVMSNPHLGDHCELPEEISSEKNVETDEGDRLEAFVELDGDRKEYDHRI